MLLQSIDLLFLFLQIYENLKSLGFFWRSWLSYLLFNFSIFFKKIIFDSLKKALHNYSSQKLLCDCNFLSEKGKNSRRLSMHLSHISSICLFFCWYLFWEVPLKRITYLENKSNITVISLMKRFIRWLKYFSFVFE